MTDLDSQQHNGANALPKPALKRPSTGELLSFDARAARVQDLEGKLGLPGDLARERRGREGGGRPIDATNDLSHARFRARQTGPPAAGRDTTGGPPMWPGHTVTVDFAATMV
jgi:hypothetical protein